MTNRSVAEGEVFLNGQRYPLFAGENGKRVRTTGASQYPQKIILGDVDKDSNPRTSLVVWDDWSGGVSLYSTDGKEGLNRSLFSQADGRYKNHLTLPPLYTAAADSTIAGLTTALNELGTVLYVAVGNGTKIHSYTPSSDTWSAELHSLGTSVYHNIAFTLSGTDYIAFAFTTGYTYTSDGSSWTDDTADVIDFAFWDDRLWGIDNTGQLWFSTIIGTEVNDAKLALPDGYAHRLFVGPDAAGEDILYVATEVGLYAHDAANSRFVRTKVVFPRQAVTDVNSVATQGAATWNGEIYITAGGMTVYRYDPSRGVYFAVGLNKDAGMPVGTTRGNIVALIPTHVGLLAVMDGFSSSDGTVWEYNGVGWHYYGRIDASTTGHHVSSIGGNYRFYHAFSTDDLGYMALQTGQVNPDIETISYEGTNDIATHITPWFNAGQNEIDKTAIRGRIDCTGMSATEAVKVEFALNYSSSYEASSITVIADGVTTFTFPTIANNSVEAGSAFRSIRFRLTLNRGGTATNTPNVKSLSLEWRRKIPAKYGFSFDVDRTNASFNNQTPREMKANLITAFESDVLVEFTFVSDDGGTQNYFVDVTQLEDIQNAGREGEEKGITRVTVVEI